MIQNKTITYYQKKTADVLQYINNNVGENLSIRLLSELFGISFYHFHRIMKAALNEPLGEYINRVRLETALKLLRYSTEQLTEIAQNIGYSDLSSFSKAFTKEFGISPLEYRNDKSIILNTNIDYRISDERKIIVNLKPKIITVPDKKVCYITVKGKYGSDVVSKAWDELAGFAAENKIIGWKPDIFSIYYDDPDITNIDLCSSDICIATSKIFREEGRIRFKTVPGAKYLVFRYKGSYDYLWDIYNCIYKDWILQSDYKLLDMPSVEKYLTYSHSTKAEDQLTEIYIPIE